MPRNLSCFPIQLIGFLVRLATRINQSRIRLTGFKFGLTCLPINGLPGFPTQLIYFPSPFGWPVSPLAGLRFRIRSDPVFLPGSGFGFQISLDLGPDPVFKFLWIRVRIRFSNFSGSGSGFSPDSGTKKECRKVSFPHFDLNFPWMQLLAIRIFWKFHIWDNW